MSYLEEVLSSINYFPIELARSLDLIRQLDYKAEELTKELQYLTTDYFNTLTKDGKTMLENTNLLQKIRQKQEEVSNLSDEKIAISKQILDMADTESRRLEKDLLTYSSDVKSEEGSPLKRQKSEKDSTVADEEFSVYLDEEFQSNIRHNYCYCNKPCYGEMVACDGGNCKYEWFHFQCAGLTAKPNGQWYCNECKPKSS
ncbi:unnamed protein product [Blepharisma stoltei]|uniref:Inhibitor of growth protein n=1 Tax=Blepharisma stoltei TaxID=1481888 RepID=A0AAU9IYH0_9CILI|nr:unnamed protein product [Blepharisma stoltei]